MENPAGLPEPMRSDKFIYRFAVVVLGVTVILTVVGVIVPSYPGVPSCGGNPVSVNGTCEYS